MKTIGEEFSYTYPENLKNIDRPFFEPHFSNPLYTQNILSFHNVFFFKFGMISNLKMQPIKQNLPWNDCALGFGKGYFIKTIIKHTLLNKAGALLGRKTKFCIATNSFSDNFYHWFVEVVPKVIALQEALKNGMVLLLPDQYDKKYQLKSLEILGIKHMVIKKEIVFIPRVYIVSRESDFIGYNSKKTIQRLGNRLRNSLSTSFVPSTTDKVYISRQKAGRRKLVNEDAILPVLVDLGFKVIYAEELSFTDTILFFSKVRYLVAVHGAGLTNMIYMPKGSKIFEFLKEKTLTDKCYFTLSLACEHSYYYMSCRGVGNEENHIEADIEIDVEQFKKEMVSFLD